MDVGLGWVTRHSPNLRYEHLCNDKFMVVVTEKHPWARRRAIDLSELHRQRLLQLPDTYVMRRMTDEICRNHRIRPRAVAEVNSIETLLRFLEPLRGGRFDAASFVARRGTSEIESHQSGGSRPGPGDWPLAADRFGDEQRGGSIHQARQNGHPENDRGKRRLGAEDRGSGKALSSFPAGRRALKSTFGKPLR